MREFIFEALDKKNGLAYDDLAEHILQHTALPVVFVGNKKRYPTLDKHLVQLERSEAIWIGRQGEIYTPPIYRK